MDAAQLQQYITAYRAELQTPFARYASFDYCYNYFKGFYRQGRLAELADEAHLEISVLQLGFYLASWGMYRGSTAILQHSSQVLVPVIKVIANTPSAFWTLDAPDYNTDRIDDLIQLYDTIGQSIHFPIPIKRKGNQYLQQPTAILVTKIMLGVFGNTPAMDEFFCKGFETFLGQGSYTSTRSKVISIWRRLARIYQTNASLLNEMQFETMSFSPGGLTMRYPIAKLLDMAYFQRGADIIEAKKKAKASLADETNVDLDS